MDVDAHNWVMCDSIQFTQTNKELLIIPNKDKLQQCHE